VPEHPYNYKVANFGVDREISSTLNHASEAEKRLKHVFNPKEYDANYIHPW
jgi:hypothetical protein